MLVAWSSTLPRAPPCIPLHPTVLTGRPLLTAHALQVMEGKPEDAVPEVQAKLLPVMCANYALWPLVRVRLQLRL